MTNTLPFSKVLSGSNFENISWNVISTADFVPFPLDGDEDEKYDAEDSFFERLSSQVDWNQAEPLHIALYLKDGGSADDQTAVIYYYPGKIVVPALLENSPAWDTWAQGLRGNFKGTIYLKLRPRGRSTSPIYNGNPYADTGKWIVQHAPQDYFKDEHDAEKLAYINRYKNLKGAAFDPKKIENHLTKYKERKGIELSPPHIDSSVYAQFKSVAGYDFPPELQYLYSLTNGIEDFAGGYSLLPAQHVLTEWINWKKIYDEWTLSDLTDQYHSDEGSTLPIYTTPYWTPFLSDHCGNFLAIDYAPNSKGTSGQIIAFGADMHLIRRTARDLTVFLQYLSIGIDAVNIGR